LATALREGPGLGNPLSILEREEARKAVRSAMLRISRRDAEILALRYGGSSYREIAQALSVELGQVGTRLARAERALRREIEHETL